MKKINKTKYNTGMLTLEIIIAFAILVLNISAVLLLTAGGQNIYVDIETNTEALSKAQANLETEITKSKINFDATSPSTTNDGIYTKKISVFDLTPCKKEIDSTVSWSLSPLRTLEVALNSFIASPDQIIALGGDCSTTPPQGDDWKKPEDLNYSGVGLKTDGFGKAVDSQNNIAFLVSKASGNNKDDFFIFDTSDINNPIKTASLDVSDGLEDIDVALNYAFIANDETKNTKQLAISDISDINAPSNPIFLNLPGVSGTCPNTCPGGRSIFYFKEKIYMGLHRLTANGAKEFHIIDVSSPLSPSWLGGKGGTSIGDTVDHNINDIYVREQSVNGTKRTYAYLATSSNDGEIIVLNVTDPSSIPDPAGTASSGSILNLPGDLDATTLTIIGNKLYVGRDRATGTNADFFIIDISNPASLQILGSKKLNLANNSYVSGLDISSHLAFITTTDSNQPFFVLDIANPSNITDWVLSGCNLNFSTYPTDLDYSNNLLYISLYNATSNVNLKIIKPIGGSC